MCDHRAFDQGRTSRQQIGHRAGLVALGQFAPGGRGAVQRRRTKGRDDRRQVGGRQSAQVGHLQIMPGGTQRLDRRAAGIAGGQGKDAQTFLIHLMASDKPIVPKSALSNNATVWPSQNSTPF